MANPKDTLLIRLQRGDAQALSDLADTYGARIYQLAFRYLRNKEDAEEVAQDVLFKIHRKVGEFRGDAALSSWIYRITFNAAMSRLRSGSYQRAQEEQRLSAAHEREDLDARPRHEPVDWSELADEQLFQTQLRKRMFSAILALPAIYRAPVMLRDIQG